MNSTSRTNTDKDFFRLLPRKYSGYVWGLLVLIGIAIRYLTRDSHNIIITLISSIPVCISFGVGILLTHATATFSNEYPLKRASWVIAIGSAIPFLIITVLVLIQSQH